MIKLTHKLILTAGYLNKTQAELLKLEWPLVQGWVYSLIGKSVTEELWFKVVALRGLRRGKREEILQGQKQFEV